MSNFQEPDYVSEFEPIRNEFGQAMFGSNWLEFANYRDGDVELPPYMLDRNALTCPMGNTCSMVPGTNGMWEIPVSATNAPRQFLRAIVLP